MIYRLALKNSFIKSAQSSLQILFTISVLGWKGFLLVKRRQPCFSRFAWSLMDLQIRANDFLNSTESGKFKNALRLEAFVAAVESQPLHCNIEADLVAEFEAVGDGLLGTVHTDRHPVDRVRFDASRESRCRKSKDAKWWVVEQRSSRCSRQRQMHFVRDLRGELVECEC